MIPMKKAIYTYWVTPPPPPSPPANPALMIHAVSVVPMCAPRMTEMACPSVRSPALTKETVINVVAVDD